MSTKLPPNVHISTHPCLQAKLSQLRNTTTNARETKALVHEISLIIGCEALAAGLSSQPGETAQTHLGHDYTTTTIHPQTISLVPILRSGLGMLDAIQTLLPSPVPVHHLGLFREPTTLQPVEYYNNLPYHSPSSSDNNNNNVEETSSASSSNTTHHPSGAGSTSASSLAILLDPVIATGGTSAAAIQTLREWGVKRVLVISILGAREGVERAAGEWSEGTEIWCAGLDEGVNEKGMIMPGLGDVGDRLFLTLGK